MSDPITFFAEGIPCPGGSKQAWVPTNKAGEPFRRPGGSIIVNVVDDAGKRNKEWKKLVGWAAKSAMKGVKPLTSPLMMKLQFLMPRPKGHLRTNGEVKESAPTHHVTRPDASKLARAVEDGMTGVVYADDAQIIFQTVAKEYTTGQPGCHIEILEVVTAHPILL